MEASQDNRYRIIFFMLWLGIGAVYFSHLGVIPLHTTADECRRALVPLEMHLTGDWLTPTINGEVYLNKPPLFNQIVAVSYSFFGGYSPFALRFPVVMSILLNGLVIYWVMRRHVSVSVAGLSALAFMTNWRTLTLDSIQGLLEHTLTLFLYTGFMLIYILGEKRKFLLLFTSAYLIMAIGFMIKGLPAIAHMGLGLGLYCFWSGNRKQLWGASHFIGLAVFGLLLIAYYIPFLRHNSLSIWQVFGTLTSESTKRYGLAGLGHFLYNLIDFPLDVLRHFLPWTVFMVFLFRKSWNAILRENRFIFFNALLFAVNIPIYWVAELKSPHYLYFLLPMFFAVCFYFWERTAVTDYRHRAVEFVFGGIMGMAILAAIYFPFTNLLAGISQVALKSSILVFGLSGTLFLFYRLPAMRMFFFVAALIWVRLAFNWFVMPQRVSDQMVFPQLADQIQNIVQEKPLHIMASYPAGYYDPITFPLEWRRKEILRMAVQPDSNGYFLMDDPMLEKYSAVPLLSFPFTYADRNERFDGNMHLVKFQPAD